MKRRESPPKFHRFNSPEQFLSNKDFSPELIDAYVKRIDENEGGGAGNIGGAELRYPNPKLLNSGVYTGESLPGSTTNTALHGERTAIFNALNGEIEQLRKNKYLNYDKDKPHSKYNIRRPISPVPGSNTSKKTW